MVIAGILIGIVVGAAGAWLALSGPYASKLAVLDDARGSLETTMKALASDALASSSESFLKLAKSQLEQLQQKTTNDLEQRKQAVEHLVAPLKESLTKVDGKLQELEVARKGAYSSLTEQVRQLLETQ
jgi:DNA recombination protein RmuC